MFPRVFFPRSWSIYHVGLFSVNESNERCQIYSHFGFNLSRYFLKDETGHGGWSEIQKNGVKNLIMIHVFWFNFHMQLRCFTQQNNYHIPDLVQDYCNLQDWLVNVRMCTLFFYAFFECYMYVNHDVIVLCIQCQWYIPMRQKSCSWTEVKSVHILYFFLLFFLIF